MAYIAKIGDDEDWRGVVDSFRPEDLEEINLRCDMRRIARYVTSTCYGNAGVYTDRGELVGVLWTYGGVCIYIRPPLDRDSPELREALLEWLDKLGDRVEAFVDARNPERIASWERLGFSVDGPPKAFSRSFYTPWPHNPLGDRVVPPPGGFAVYRLTRTPT